MLKKLQAYYNRYKRYVQVDVLMYLFMILFILMLFIFFS